MPAVSPLHAVLEQSRVPAACQGQGTVGQKSMQVFIQTKKDSCKQSKRDEK